MSDRTKPMSRAIRRHHRQRLYKTRRFHWGRDLMQASDRTRGQVINTPTPCSCYGCGNPRHHKICPYQGKTLQEVRFEMHWKEWNV